MYNAAKAAQIIAYFALKNDKRSIHVVKAITLVYLADRESLRRMAAPMLDEPRYSLKLGPVNSSTYDLIKGEAIDSHWSTILQDRANHEVGLQPGITIDDLDELSDAEAAILDDLWCQFGNMDSFDLANWTHDPKNVPEWSDPGYGSTEITIEEIMTAVGVPDPKARSEELKDLSSIGALLARLAA